VRQVEKYLGKELNPITGDEILYNKLTSEIYVKIKMGDTPLEEIKKAALLRKSMG
jgi:hypothetical protein